MRRDFWFFQSYLLGMGTLKDSRPHSLESLRLIVSFNAPMVLDVEGRRCECSMAALDSRAPHSIDGGEGWQFFGYIHPQTQLGALIKKKLAATDGPLCADTSGALNREPLTPSLNNEPSAQQIRELWEFLLSHLLGIKSYSLGWSPELKEITSQIRSLPPGELNLDNLARLRNTYPALLQEEFTRLAGIPLVHYLFNVKLVRASELIKAGRDYEEALHGAGLTGPASAEAYMDKLYGLDLEHLLKEKPRVRFYSAADSEPLSGHAL